MNNINSSWQDNRLRPKNRISIILKEHKYTIATILIIIITGGYFLNNLFQSKYNVKIVPNRLTNNEVFSLIPNVEQAQAKPNPTSNTISNNESIDNNVDNESVECQKSLDSSIEINENNQDYFIKPEIITLAPINNSYVASHTFYLAFSTNTPTIAHLSFDNIVQNNNFSTTHTIKITTPSGATKINPILTIQDEFGNSTIYPLIYFK